MGIDIKGESPLVTVDSVQIEDAKPPQQPVATKHPVPGEEPKKRGRPAKNKVFVSELPAPRVFDFIDANEFFAYVRTIGKELRNRVFLVFYRIFPIVDLQEVDDTGKKVGNKHILKLNMDREPFPFDDENWELQLLHMFGSGDYNCWLTEANASGSKPVCRCFNIKTRWDLENYPPVLDPDTVVHEGELGKKNAAYLQYLFSRGHKLPTEQDKALEEAQMEAIQANQVLAKGLVDMATRAQTPVPPLPTNDKVIVEIVKPMMEMVSQSQKAQIDGLQKQNSANDPLASIQAIGGVLRELKGSDAKPDNSAIETMLKETMTTNRMLMDKMLSSAGSPTKTATEQLNDMLGCMERIQNLAGGGKKEEGEGSDKESLAQSIVKVLPTVVPAALGFIDRGIQVFQMVRNGPTPYPPGTNPQTAAAPIPPAPQVEAPPIIPEVLTAEQQQAEAEKLVYQQYIPLIASVAQPILQHLNDSGHTDEDGEFIRADGFDFAEWIIKPTTEGGGGYGRVAYETIKALGPDVLLGAMKAYQPLWQQISAIEGKVKEFISEFLTYDDDAGPEGEGKADVAKA